MLPRHKGGLPSARYKFGVTGTSQKPDRLAQTAAWRSPEIEALVSGLLKKKGTTGRVIWCRAEPRTCGTLKRSCGYQVVKEEGHYACTNTLTFGRFRIPLNRTPSRVYDCQPSTSQDAKRKIVGWAYITILWYGTSKFISTYRLSRSTVGSLNQAANKPVATQRLPI